MEQEERLALLLSRARTDYAQILADMDFNKETVEEQAERLTLAKAFLTCMETTLMDCASDVEALLFYEQPVTAMVDGFHTDCKPLWNDLMESFDRLIQGTKRHITELLEQSGGTQEQDYEEER